VSEFGARFFKTRWAVRAPIALFRARLGFLFGGRLLLLVHRGRRSGADRFVALEAVEREGRHAVVIASGFGTQAQWYLNLRADPSCEVSIGFRNRVPARAELLDPAESGKLLEKYAAKHPSGWKMLKKSISDVTGDPDPQIPMVRLRLEN
jgi:deazaflavin-dependent oxidoreductase (nitroreductase family)